MAAAAEAEGRPEAERIAEQVKDLEENWSRLQDENAKRRERLGGSNMAQQYYNDADEAEAWIGEQELYMIADEKAKVWGAEQWFPKPGVGTPSGVPELLCGDPKMISLMSIFFSLPQSSQIIQHPV